MKCAMLLLISLLVLATSAAPQQRWRSAASEYDMRPGRFAATTADEDDEDGREGGGVIYVQERSGKYVKILWT